MVSLAWDSRCWRTDDTTGKNKTARRRTAAPSKHHKISTDSLVSKQKLLGAEYLFRFSFTEI